MYAGIGGYGDIPGGKNVPGLGYYYWRPEGFYPKRTFYPGHRAYYGVNGLGAALEPGPTPTIKRGSKEPVADTAGPIHRWQRVIGVKDDGDFGPTTEKVTKEWQAGHSVQGAVPGVVGPETWAAAAVQSAPAGTPVPTAPVPGAKPHYTISPSIIAAMIKKPAGGAATTAAGGGWWSQQSTMTKVAIAGGGVAALGLVAFLLLGKKSRSATPNPGRRRRRRRKSPWCGAAVKKCDGPYLLRRAS